MAADVTISTPTVIVINPAATVVNTIASVTVLAPFGSMSCPECPPAGGGSTRPVSGMIYPRGQG